MVLRNPWTGPVPGCGIRRLLGEALQRCALGALLRSASCSGIWAGFEHAPTSAARNSLVKGCHNFFSTSLHLLRHGESRRKRCRCVFQPLEAASGLPIVRNDSRPTSRLKFCSQTNSPERSVAGFSSQNEPADSDLVDKWPRFEHASVGFDTPVHARAIRFLTMKIYVLVVDAAIDHHLDCALVRAYHCGEAFKIHPMAILLLFLLGNCETKRYDLCSFRFQPRRPPCCTPPHVACRRAPRSSSVHRTME